jgi:hypothetical protein
MFERCLSNISQTSKTFFMFMNEMERSKRKVRKPRNVWEMFELSREMLKIMVNTQKIVKLVFLCSKKTEKCLGNV